MMEVEEGTVYDPDDIEPDAGAQSAVLITSDDIEDDEEPDDDTELEKL